MPPFNVQGNLRGRDRRKGNVCHLQCLSSVWVRMPTIRKREEREGRRWAKEHGMTCFPLLGTLGYNESSFHMEMSQIGFSTHTLDVSPTLFNSLWASNWLSFISAHHSFPAPFFRMAFCLAWWGPMTGMGVCWKKGPMGESCHPERPLKASFLWSSKIMLLI